MSDLKYWLGFNLVKGIGSAKMQALIDFYGSAEAAWGANELQLQRIGLDKRAIQTFLQTRAELNLDAYLEQVQQAGIQVLTWGSADYPKYLREVPNAPPVLYLQGEMTEIDQWAVAVVGTRRLTAYGRQITRELVSGLVQHQVTVVSGLARGIDAVAHQTAVEQGGRTLAILGSGLDCIYPHENRQLAEKIIHNKQGAIISEYALGVQPEAKNFPPRNRIISGLSLGVIVVEAGEKSGALITTTFALEQNREVFAVPGNINSPASKGPNQLIQQGAKLITRVEDVLEELNIHLVAEQTAVQLALPETSEEAAIYARLSGQPIHIDEISRETGLSVNAVSSALTMMELKGMVLQTSGMNYMLAREPEPEYNINPPQNPE
jgi:DNA processing protein